MKFLLAFALVAAASALPEPVRLLDPAPVAQEAAYAPLHLPQEVYNTVKVVNVVQNADGTVEQNEEVSAFAVNFVDEAVNAEIPAAVAEDASAFAVKFVDEAVNAEAPAAVEAEDASAFAVKFVDEAVNAEAPAAAEAEDASAFAVKFVDEAVNAEAPAAAEAEDASAFAVKFVDEAVNAEAPVAAEGEITYTNYVVEHIEEAANEEAGTPYTVRVVELPVLPLPASVVLPLDAMMPSIAPAMVDGHVVQVAETNEEIPRFPKQYPNPMWR